MLVEGMTEVELNTAIFRDFNIILNSTTQTRVEHSYIEIRKRMKIDKWENYPVFTSIKTKAKNQWILRTDKEHELSSLKSAENVSTSFITYYHTHKGIRIFIPASDKKLMVYNGHLFTRYRERMKLTTDDPLTIIKQFFFMNYNQLIKEYDKNEIGETRFISFEKEGYLLGTIQEFPSKIKWLVHKTFIPKSTATYNQLETSNYVKLESAKQLLHFKLGLTSELSASIKECCHLYGFYDKEVTVDFLKHLIEDMESH